MDNTNFTGATVLRGSWFRATCYHAKMDGLTISGTNLERVWPDLTCLLMEWGHIRGD